VSVIACGFFLFSRSKSSVIKSLIMNDQLRRQPKIDFQTLIKKRPEKTEKENIKIFNEIGL
jgi:hypothetical protein